MQRTVRMYQITLPKIEIEKGQPKTTLIEHYVREYDEKKAVRIAQKETGLKYPPLKIRYVDEIYYLDDEIFFQYASTEKPTKEKP